MVFSTDQFAFFLSGGFGNTDLSASIGGLPSNKQIPGGTNNLFSKVTTTEESSGGSRYRCIYLSNTSDYPLKNITIWVDQQPEFLSDIQIGIEKRNEIQQINFTRSVFGGTFSLRYIIREGNFLIVQNTSNITWYPDANNTANAIQSALNALTYLDDVTVTATVTTSPSDPLIPFIYFTINFTKLSGDKTHNLLEFDSLALISDDVQTSIEAKIKGSPINAVATNIGFENQAPSGVVFSQTSEGEPLSFESMLPGDVIGIWVRRFTAANTAAGFQDQDSCLIKTKYLVTF